MGFTVDEAFPACPQQMAAQLQAMSDTQRVPLSPANGRAAAKASQMKAGSPSVNPLALKADWAREDPVVNDEDDEDEDPLMAKVGSPRPKKGKSRRSSGGAARLSELLAAAVVSNTGGGAACFASSDTERPTRCQIARRRGVYTLLSAGGQVLLTAKHSLTGKWTVNDGRGNYVGNCLQERDMHI